MLAIPLDIRQNGNSSFHCFLGRYWVSTTFCLPGAALKHHSVWADARDEYAALKQTGVKSIRLEAA